MVKAPPVIPYFVKQILRKMPTDLYYHDKRLEMYHKTAKREFSESNFALHENWASTNFVKPFDGFGQYCIVSWYSLYDDKKSMN